MTKWQKQESKVLEHFEYIRDAGGAFIGYVSRFTGDPRCYAWTTKQKIGEYASIGEAKDALEALIKPKGKKK